MISHQHTVRNSSKQNLRNDASGVQVVMGRNKRAIPSHAYHADIIGMRYRASTPRIGSGLSNCTFLVYKLDFTHIPEIPEYATVIYGPEISIVDLETASQL